MPALAVHVALQGRAATGAPLVYVITVANVGSVPTTAPVTLVDHLPPGVEFQQVNATGLACTPMAPMVHCMYPLPLSPGQISPPVRVTVVVTATAGSDLVNVAVANSGEASATAGNNVRVLGPAAPAPLLSPLGLLAALTMLIAVAARARRRVAQVISQERR